MDPYEAMKIVLDLAKQNVLEAEESEFENRRQETAIRIVEEHFLGED